MVYDPNNGTLYNMRCGQVKVIRMLTVYTIHIEIPVTCHIVILCLEIHASPQNVLMLFKIVFES